MSDIELKKAIDKIFSLESDTNDIKLGLEIKNRFCPRKIYKFRTLSKNSVNNVIENSIWFDNPINMNDPYECKMIWDNSADRNLFSAKEYQSLFIDEPDEFDPNIFEYLSENKVTHNDFLSKFNLKGESLSFMKDVLSKMHEKSISEFVNSLLNKIYFCSFTENVNSMLMWTHYSNEHCGFCIEYNSTKIDVNNPYINQLYPVFYTDNIFNISDLIYSPKDKILSRAYNVLYLNYPLIYKSYEWDYEKEWRVIHSHGLLDKAQNLPTPPISAILLGSNFFKTFRVKDANKISNSDETLSLAFQLINHCKEKGIELKIMKHSSFTYSMIDEPISYEECLKLLQT